MKRVSQTTQFSKDVKRMKKRGKDLEKLKAVVTTLAKDTALDLEHRDHPRVASCIDARDCHVAPDGVLIYSTNETTLRLARTGTHSDLFKK